MSIRHLWTNEQDVILTKLWGKVTTGDIAIKIGTNRRQVYHRAMSLKLPRLKDAPSQGGQFYLVYQIGDSNKMFLHAYSAWAKKNNIDLHPYRKREA
jgi:hypothetical protein